MWDNLSTSDIEQAKQQLTLRRQEILSRHAEEIRALEAEGAEIEALDRLAEAFARKFKNPMAPDAEREAAPEPDATPEAKPAAAAHSHSVRRSSRAAPADDDEPNYARTNFAIFKRAASQL